MSEAVFLTFVLSCCCEEEKTALGQRFARWLWSPGSQSPPSGPENGRGTAGHPQGLQGQDNCLPCDKIPWVPVARALGHVPATYQSHGSKYTFQVPTIGLLPLRQLASSYGPPKPEYGPPKQEYGPPKPEYGPPKPEYGPPRPDYGPPKLEYKPPNQDFGPPKSVYGPLKLEYSHPNQEYGPPKLEYGPPKTDFNPPPPPDYGPPKHDFTPPNPQYGPPKTNYGPPKLEYGPPKLEIGPALNSIKSEYLPSEQHSPSQGHDQPKLPNVSQLHFIAPKPEYGQPDFGLPKHNYGPPNSEYGPPKSEYGPPKAAKAEFGPPQPEYGPPKQEFHPPNSEYGPPKQEFHPPNPEFGPPKGPFGPPKSEYGPPKQQFLGNGPPPLKFSYGPNHKGSYRPPAPRFQGAPLTLLTPPKLPFQLQNPSFRQHPPEAMSFQSFHQYLTPPHAQNGPNIKHEHTIIHTQGPGRFNVHQNNPPLILTISDQSQACNKCPSGPNLGPEPHTPGIEDATKEVGNFGDLPLSDSAHEASSSVTTSQSLPITEVSVTKSVPISEYLSSIEFPVQIIQAPLLDIPELPKYVNLGYGDVEDQFKGHHHHYENNIRNLRDEGGKIPDSDKASSTRQSSRSNVNSIHTNHKIEEIIKGYPTTPQPTGYHYYSHTLEPFTETTPIFPTTFSTFFLPDTSPTVGPQGETNAHGPMQYFDVRNTTFIEEKRNDEKTEIELLDSQARIAPPQKSISWTTIASSQARPFSTQSSQVDQIVLPYGTIQKADLLINNQARKVPIDPLKQPDLEAMMVNREIAGQGFRFPSGTEHLEPVDLPRLIDTLPPDVAKKLRELVEKHGESELRHIIAQNLQDLLRKEEDSVDIVRLQKNIDNWTAEGFRRAFTNLPQFDSKKIPEEYLTTSMPEYEASGSHLDPVQSKNNSSDYIKVIKGWALVETKMMTTTEVTPEKQPWEKLEVSISPLTKEKVYVVTPLNSKEHPTTIPPDLPNRITRESAKSTKGTVATTTASTTTSTTTFRSPRNADNLIDGVTASVRYLGRNGR